MKKPSSWIVVCYDVPPEPSKLKVRLWREFKRVGALYPQMSVCIIPDTSETRKSMEKIVGMITDNGTVIKMLSKSISESDQKQLTSMFRNERDRQYEEILGECRRVVDEIALNIKSKKTTQEEVEEVEEMEEALDGLRRWLKRIKTMDWIEGSKASMRVESLLEECQKSMDHFADLSQPK
jgi:DNA repair exonuclease SbcCD ATPase subunit